MNARAQLEAQSADRAVNVLHIEDNPIDVLFLQEALQGVSDMAFRVTAVPRLGEGLKLLRRLPFDGVVLDLNLPDSQGEATMDRLRCEFPALPLIVLTGNMDVEVAARILRKGAQDCLWKSPDFGPALSRSIRFAIERQQCTTELEQSRCELQQSEAHLRTVIDANADALMLLSPDGQVRFVNPAACQMFGRDKADLLGQPFGFPVANGETTELDLHRRDGTIGIAEMRVTEIIWAGSPVYLASLRDITDRKAMEGKLEKANRELEATVAQLEEANRQIIAQQKSVIEEERLKVLLQMAGATAHELNQPLMSLLGSIELVRYKAEIDAKSLERIDAAGRRIAEIVQKIQCIRRDQTLPYPGSVPIIKIDQRLNILVVEDNPDDYSRLQQLAERIGSLILEHASCQQAAFERLETACFDMILLDYQLPDGTGLGFLESLKQTQLDVPVVIITGQGDEILASNSIQAGAYDYLPKAQLTVASLTRIITNTMEKSRFQREIKRMNEKLAQMASRDELTGLYNRRYFNESLQKEIQRAQRYGKNMSLAILDLDHFKHINDTYGHLAGDHVLRQVGKLVLETIRQTDIACRYGGEEIAVIMPETDLTHSALVCERIRQRIDQLPMEHNGNRFGVSISAGVAVFDPCSPISADELVDTVDRLLYEAKATGRNRVSADVKTEPA